MSDAPSPSETMGVAEPWRGLPAGTDPKSFERAEPWRGLPPGSDPKSFEQPLSATDAGLAPGFSRSQSGELTREGRPPDFYFGAGGATPAWQTGQDTSPATRQRIYDEAVNDPTAIPPEAGPVIKVIRAAEGTKQGEGFVLYGGEPFIPGKQHPAAYGWQGGTGPTGAPTHAAGPGQWQPSTWEDERKRAAAQGVDLDFGNPKHQNWAIWDRASRIYKDKTGRDLAGDVKTGKVDYSTLGSEWAGLLRQQGPTLGDQWGAWSEGARELIKQRGAANDATANQMRGTLAEYQRQAASAPEGSKERDAAIEESRRLSHQLQNFMADIARHPPVEKPVDAFQNFGSAATIFGLLGGLFARHHLTAALSAAGTAMQAINQNNHQQFENQMRVWQQETTLAMNMASLQQADLRALIEDKRMAVDEKNTRLGNLIAEAGMVKTIGGLRTDTIDGALELQKTLATLQMQMQNHRDTIQMHYDTLMGQKARQQEMVIEGEVQRLDTAFVVGHPDATQEDRDRAHYENRLKVERDMGQALHQPRSAPGMALQTFLDEFPKTHDGKQASSEDIRDFMATQAERIREASTVGNRAAALEMAANAADALIPLLKASSDKINRTDYPDVNSLIIAYEKKTGGEEVVRYGEMINSLRYAYSRALSPTGQTRVADLKNFDDIMNQAWSKGQINAALDQIHTSINAEKGAIARTRAEVTRPGGIPLTQAPPPATAGKYKSADDVLADPNLTDEQARKILQEQFGYKAK